MFIRRSACPYDCPDTCGLQVRVDNMTAIGVAGDPLHPHSKGRLCSKMAHYEKTVHSPHRLVTPLRRSGAKGSGSFVTIPWEEAIDSIAERWQSITSRYGAEAILPYSYAGTMGLVQRNSGHPLFHRLGAARLERTICTPAKDAGWKAVMGETPSIHPDDALASDLIILWGINAAATDVQFLHRVAAARRKGATVWGIDVYRTPTMRACDRSIILRPGTDGLLALGLMRIIVDENLIDNAFIRDHTEGFKEFSETVLPQNPPEAVSETTGIPVSEMKQLAHALGRASRPLIRLGGGLTRAGNGAASVRAIVTLPALIGAYAKTGGGCFCGTSTGSGIPLTSITREDFLPFPLPRQINMNQLGDALTSLQPPIMSLYVYHANPAAVTPDQNAVISGLSRDDLFTVVHERFMTDTARYADIILPATSSLEHSDIYRAYGSYTLQRTKAVIPPVGESKSNREVFSLLARALGYKDDIFFLSDDQVIELLLSQKTPLLAGIDRERLDAGLAVEFSCVRTPPTTFATPSGKIRIRNDQLDSPLPGWFPTHSSSQTENYPLQFITAPTPYALNSSFYEQDELRQRQKRPELLINPIDADHRSISHGQLLEVTSPQGTFRCHAALTDRVPPGTVVSEGVWWRTFCEGEQGVNVLSSQRLTDRGNGSTFSDIRVEVRAA